MTPGRSEDSAKELRRLLAGALADRYTLGRIIGSGGMAMVYAARDLVRDRPVAIKVMRPEVIDSVATTRFIREILWSSRLQHPHIVPLLDSGEAAGFPYAVMPLIEGESLAARLAKAPPLQLAEALRYGEQIASALDYAHGKGVVHRDIKPDNILLSHGYALVADFGIARALGLASGTGLTGPGSPIGTLAYMSPEQATGSSDIDGRTDIYSLACVVYEMLAGRPAVDDTSIRAVLFGQSTTAPLPLQSIRPELPDAVADAIMRSLDRIPAARVQTAQEFAEVMRDGAATVQVEPVSAHAARTGLWLLVAAAAAIGALILTFLLVP